jgi:hypothetical protein
MLNLDHFIYFLLRSTTKPNYHFILSFLGISTAYKDYGTYLGGLKANIYLERKMEITVLVKYGLDLFISLISFIQVQLNGG